MVQYMSSGHFPNVCVHVEVGDLRHLFHALIFLLSSHYFPQPIAVFTQLLMAAVRATRGHMDHVLHTSSCATHIVLTRQTAYKLDCVRGTETFAYSLCPALPSAPKPRVLSAAQPSVNSEEPWARNESAGIQIEFKS